MEISVLPFGEIVWDIIGGQKHLGGAPFNFAATIAKFGGQVSIISAVGNDVLGKQALAAIEKLNVGLAMVKTLDGVPTSTVDVLLEKGEPKYVIHEKVSFDFIPAPDTHQLSGSYDLFYFGTLAQRSEKSRATLHWLLNTIAARHIFCDLNLRQEYFTKEIIEYSLTSCSILKINEDEAGLLAAMLVGTALSKQDLSIFLTRSYNIELIIITAAEKGCYVFRNGRYSHIPGEPVKIADAVGAGDAFSAAFIHSYFKDRDEVKAAAIANKIGAFVASQQGAVPNYSRTILEALM